MSTDRHAEPVPLLVDRPRPGVLRLRLNRPRRRNAIDAGLLTALREALDAVAAPAGTDRPVRAVVLSSAHPGMFCAGADLAIPDDQRGAVSRGLYDLYRVMIALPVPVITALPGPAIGGGAQLAVASDVRVAHPDAWVRFAGPGHGLAVGGWALTSLVGRGRSTELCLSGRDLDAGEAAAIGLLAHVDPQPEGWALEFAAGLCDLDPSAVARTKEQAVLGLRERLDREAAGNASWDGHGPAGHRSAEPGTAGTETAAARPAGGPPSPADR